MIDRVVEMGAQEFEETVVDALDEIPEDLARAMVDVVVLVADDPPEGAPADLLGLYEGTPLTHRDSWWAAGSLPDRITVFRNPILAICADRDEVLAEVRITVVHEVGHHFGLADLRLHELGWA